MTTSLAARTTTTPAPVAAGPSATWLLGARSVPVVLPAVRLHRAA